MVQRLLGSAVKGTAVDRGIQGAEPGSTPPFLAIGHLLFDSVAAFEAAIAPHAQVIFADVANYTDAQPIIQISEVTL